MTAKTVLFAVVLCHVCNGWLGCANEPKLRRVGWQQSSLSIAGIPLYLDTIPIDKAEALTQYGIQLMPLEPQSHLDVSDLTIAINKYPPEVREQCLRGVILVDEIWTWDAEFQEAQQAQAAYIGDYIILDYEPGGNEASFHHEMSSLILRVHMDAFEKEAWYRELPPGFEYCGQWGVPPIPANFTLALIEAGFVDAYGETSLENDFNSIAEMLMQMELDGRPFGRGMQISAPRLEAKAQIVIDFYRGLGIPCPPDGSVETR